jgi:hypothetical protein
MLNINYFYISNPQQAKTMSSNMSAIIKSADTDVFASILAKKFHLEFQAREDREKRREDVLLAMLKSGIKGKSLILDNSKK